MLYSDSITLAKRFETEMLTELRPSYNIAPSQTIPIVRQEGEKRVVVPVKWGLIPSWAKDTKISYSTINARAETVETKPAFRSAFKHRRCLVPADGWYEWQVLENADHKQPWFITQKDREPLAFAGLWEQWRNPEGESLESCSIIVTEANAFMKSIHNRMPVILAEDTWDTWLSPTNKEPQALQDLLIPYPKNDISAWPVSTLVNSPKHNSPECLIEQS